MQYTLNELKVLFADFVIENAMLKQQSAQQQSEIDRLKNDVDALTTTLAEAGEE